MLPLIDLTYTTYAALAFMAFCAGLVRGFTGFALSAVFMSLSVLFLPPVALIPICWVMEATASSILMRTSWKAANFKIALGLALGGAIGWPLGLWVTKHVDVQASSLIAVSLIVSLSVLQLAKIRLAILASRPGLWVSGVLAGVASGLASVGGMVVALYVLSQERSSEEMRATLILYLLLGMVVSAVSLLALGIMTQTAALRGVSLAPWIVLGVLLGKAFFTPKWEPYYKPFCLCLLISLAAVSGVRLLVA